ncbi:MAG: WhiB family transcriptional regulator [Pseudonocardiaceae bacterium]
MLTRRELPGNELAVSNVHARAFSPDDSHGLTVRATLVGDLPAPGRSLPCQTEDTDLWFAENPADLGRAQQLCGQCPILAQCLEGALRRGEPWGVWGGQIFDRGQVILFKRRKGRPAKPKPSFRLAQGNEREPQFA